MCFNWIKKQSGRTSIKYSEYSGTKTMMSGPIVQKYAREVMNFKVFSKFLCLFFVVLVYKLSEGFKACLESFGTNIR